MALHSKIPSRTVARRLAGVLPWLPLPLLFGVMTVLWAFKSTQSHESAHLLLALNALFTFSASLVTAELARRSFLDRGSPELLLLSCGALFWGAAGLLSGLLVPYGPNAFVTVHNILVWFSSGCYLSSAVVSMRPTQKLSRPGVWLAAAYACFLAITGVCAALTLSGGLPTFFVPGQGGAPPRQIVLVSAIAMFGATSILLLIRSSRSKFFKWYGLGMALIAGSIWGAMVVLTPGSLLSWTVRATQYIGSLYLLAAMLGVLHESRARRIPLERSLRESEAQLDAVFDVASVGIVQADPRDGRFLRFNPWFCDMTGYSSDELSRLRFPDLTHPDDRESEWGVFSRAAEGGAKRYRHEKRYVRKNGSVIWISVNFTFVRDEAGRPIRSFAICEDITDRKRAEEALRQSREDLDRAQAVGQIGSWRLDVRNNVLTWSDENHRIFGIPKGTPLTYETFLGAVHPEDRESVNRAWMAGLRGESYDIEHRLLVDGQVKWVRERAYLEHDPDRRLLGGFGITQDITERKRVEAELKQAKDAAENANRAKSIFLANMSHEIRTPMNGILGMTDLALMKIADPQIREYLGYVKDSGLHLLGIVNDILDLSRIEAGKVALAREPFSLKAVLAATLDSFDSGFAARNIGLSSKIDPGIPDRVVGDPGRLRQIFTNLIGNALKFTDKGRVTIAIGLENPETRDNRIMLRCTVSDTGIGIPAGDLETIFNSFEQAHGGLQSRYGGSGLGLTICKNLVELMGGRIRVESRVGEGSTFHFTALLEMAPAEIQAEESEMEPAPAVRPLKILVAEDNRINQVFIENMLKKEGHEVVLAGTGRQALTCLAEYCFDIVLMDIRMPEMSGDEAVRVIRENPPPNVKPGIPVIALTAYALETERERFMECGFDAYLTKPVEIDKLRAVLAELG